ncbi:bifunctional diguanylate cyclase/phosphodiesterase [Aliamphritea hakodatensis]|uniref:bifunctional diguanylate cyclase/phosphodiesterase n=1 Tax=Aliamphritea hakodatensis TaxID=2895352 RepID=UPI0022FD46B0|nr:GGDEF domain-containing protein [Aliamphritea hakodatensis]
MSVDIRTAEVPDSILAGWQQTVDLASEIASIPAVLIIRDQGEQLEVFVASDNLSNPFSKGSRDVQGRLCQTFIRHEDPLHVADIAQHPEWQACLAEMQGMVSYYGLPLYWPGGALFGTICVFDNRENHYADNIRALLSRFQKTIEADLESMARQARLEAANEVLTQLYEKQQQELTGLREQLSNEVDNRASMAQTLEYVQRYDALTGLPNRAALLSHMEHILSVNAEQQFAVLYIGLQNFKTINDSYGYLVGDQILQRVSDRLRHDLSGNYYVARVTGNEFVVLLVTSRIEELSVRLANRLSHSLNQPLVIDQQNITVPIKMGLAMSPTDGPDASTLLKKAGAAMNLGKVSGSAYTFFTDSMQLALDERCRLESHLVDALKNNEFSLHFQPLIATDTRRLIGAEALLRWFNPVLGHVRPDQFISLAERNGQIADIGNFVLRTAIEQISSWYRLYNYPMRMAVNISPVQFRDTGLVRYVADLLTEFELPPNMLELEITEGVLMQDEYQATRVINALKRIGVGVSLDDFGTGYASLSYLQKYAFDTLKIDRGFIAHLDNSEQDRELARAIIAMARKLKLNVIAEGIETQEQNDFILEEGCGCGQGYLYGRPVPALEFAAAHLEGQAVARNDHQMAIA